MQLQNSDHSIIEFLLNTKNYPGQVSEIIHFETHISHIFLTGIYAYKIKKPIKLDFLDFSTLEKRLFFCKREIELNCRYAPDLYEGLSCISKKEEGLFLDQQGGTAVEYAVRMKQFNNHLLFSNLVKTSELTSQIVIKLIDVIARFHRLAELAPSFFTFEKVSKYFSENFSVLTCYLSAEFKDIFLDPLILLSGALLARHRSLIEKRSISHVKFLHGDMHLGNIVIYQGRPTLFDGIEFNDEYSCCDTWADLAFLIMDLINSGKEEFAYCVINNYLTQTDDFTGLALLPLYISYRACVRAKVIVLELLEQGQDVQSKLVLRYIELAHRSLLKRAVFILAIGGLSGSGKSTLSTEISQRCRLIHIRSDVIRKQLLGVDINERAHAKAYTEEVSERVYRGLFERAKTTLAAGFPVVVDAVFLQEEHRNAIESLAHDLGIPIFGLWCEVSDETAHDRINSRSLYMEDASDATFDVYMHQKRSSIGKMNWIKLSTEGTKEEVVEEVLKKINLP